VILFRPNVQYRLVSWAAVSEALFPVKKSHKSQKSRKYSIQTPSAMMKKLDYSLCFLLSLIVASFVLMVPATCASPEESPNVTCVSGSKSQGREEDTVIKHFFQNKARGFYVEMGALDGLQFSNTIRLATCFEWSGLLMEANSKNYRMLEQNVIRRPPGITKAVRGAACPASPNGTQQFINITKAAGAVSGNPLEMEKGQLNRYFHTS
jgi:hypothetical protein